MPDVPDEVRVEVNLPEGFDEVTVLGILDYGVWSAINGRGFSLKGSRKLPWTGVGSDILGAFGWDLPDNVKQVARQAVTKCQTGEVAVGWHGSTFHVDSVGLPMDGTLGLICQKWEFIQRIRSWLEYDNDSESESGSGSD